MTQNFQAYLKLNTAKYADKYVVIINGKVVASGKAIEKILPAVRNKYPDSRPLVAKISKTETLVL